MRESPPKSGVELGCESVLNTRLAQCALFELPGDHISPSPGAIRYHHKPLGRSFKEILYSPPPRVCFAVHMVLLLIPLDLLPGEQKLVCQSDVEKPSLSVTATSK